MSEMKKLRAAVVGYGNIGRYTIEALEAAPDFEIAGVVRRDPSNVPYELRPYRVVSRIEELEDVDVAILCTPTRLVEATAQQILPLGIHTVDSFDIHTDILQLRKNSARLPVPTAPSPSSPRAGTQGVTRSSAR